MDERASGDGPSGLGCAVALGLVLVPAAALSVFGPGLPGEEWPFAIFWGVIFALPFGYLALATRRWKPWVFTAFLTVCIWGAIIFMTARGAPGVSIGVGFLMLAAPILIIVGAWTMVDTTSEQSPD